MPASTEPIKLYITLLPDGLPEFEQTIKRKFTSALDSLTEPAKQAGKKLASALDAGLQEGLQKFQQVREKLDNALSVDRRNASIEAAELRHQQKVTEIRERGAQQQATIQARQTQQLAVLQARAEADTERHQQRLSEIQNRNRGSLGQNLTSAGTALSIGVTAPLAAIAGGAVQQSLQLDSSTRALTAISGSAEEAQKQLVRLREIAKLPGIDFQGAVQGSVRLQAVGLSATEAERALKAFANAVSLTGGGAEQLNSITVQLSQLSSKGKVLAQDLRPIIEAAPAVARALKAAFGTVDSEAISKNLEEAGKSTKDFVNILLTELEKIPQVTSGPREAFDNFRITVGLALAKIGDAIVRLLIPVLTSAGDFIERFADKFSALSAPAQTFIVAVLGIAAAIGPFLLIAGKLVESFFSIKTAWLALSAAFDGGALASLPLLFTPVGLAIAAVVAVLGIAAVAWVNYESAADRAAKITVESITVAQTQIDSLKRTQTEVASLTTAQLASAEGHEKLKSAIDSLDPGTRAYINSLNNEQSKLNEVNRVLAEQ
nr:tape measure protein [Acidobacteriota bacterium]